MRCKHCRQLLEPHARSIFYEYCHVGSGFVGCVNHAENRPRLSQDAQTNATPMNEAEEALFLLEKYEAAND